MTTETDTKTTKDLAPDAILLGTLTTLLRFGALPSWCLFWHVVEPRDYLSTTERKDWEERIRRMENLKLIVRTPAPADTQYDSGLPSKTKLIRLAAAGARLLADRGITDAIGTSPDGLRASDFKIPGSWRHDALAAGMLAWLTQHDYEFITDLEVKRAAKSVGVKLPDGLVRLKGTSSWVFVEVEFAKKTGRWAGSQARAMGEAMRDGFTIANRWPVRGAWLVTTTRKDSPTPEFMAQRIAAFLTRTMKLHFFLAQVDECGKPLDITPLHVMIEPDLDARPVTLHFLGYGENYLDTMRAIQIEDAKALVPPVRPEKVVVARGAFRSFGIELSVRWPEGYPGVAHFATLTLQGQPIAVSELGDGTHLTPLMLESIAMIQQWGFADGDDGDNGPDYVVYGLVSAGRPELIRELPELQRWVRASGKSVEVIARDYGLFIQRDQQRWKE